MKILKVLLLAIIISLISVESLANEKSYKEQYNELVKDYNNLVDQDNECADRLDKITKLLEKQKEVNEGTIKTYKDVDKTIKVEKTKSLFTGGLGGFLSGALTILLIMVLL